MINQAGTACIANDAARAAIFRIRGDHGMVTMTASWYAANKLATKLAPDNGGIADNSDYDEAAHRVAVADIIACAERAAVEVAGEEARAVFWEEFNHRNNTRTGKIWETEDV